ncbi:MAG TPA: alkaline phosphatase D family protein [Solirubrobacteraceae bacterium]|nr:alkaline phosphatase D family protein [Solirubrobacteraceae bacterium]
MSRDLLLGPLVRYAGRDEATVWVETDGPGEVEVRAEGLEPARASTWTVAGHHYAIVRVRGLAPDTATPYEVHLDGAQVWPRADSPFPPSVLRTHDPERPARIVWGSCRVCVPHEQPYSFTKDEDDRGREVDALRTYALRMRHQPVEDWPHLILLLGDQVYADEVSPATCDKIKRRRDVSQPPGEEIADFEEYTMLYQESWGEPVMRWLLSTVPSAMIFDDHDVHDDWNTSLSWVEEIRDEPWWNDRITGAFMSYCVYQHWGNLPPDELEEDPFYTAVSEEEDGTEVLREFARRADREIDGVRWSYCRDVGSARVVMIDSRAGRVLTPGHRSMIDADEWRWITEHARGGVTHLILGTSLPLLLGPGLHHIEAWNEAVCDGAWGSAAAKLGEKIRRGVDLEHWPAFHRSFEAFCGLLADVATGRRGAPPETITIVSGDVHHAYLAEVGFKAGTDARSRVWQAVCSPFRNPLDSRERRGILTTWTTTAGRVGRALARAAGVDDPPIDWRLVHPEPWFDNQVARIDVDGRHAAFTLDKAVPDESDPRLERVFERAL